MFKRIAAWNGLRLYAAIPRCESGEALILIVHGTKDGTVPIAQAELFHEKLKQSGVDVTFVRIEGGRHGIGGAEVAKRVATFFDKHLRGEKVQVSAEPIKADSSLRSE